jgi:hypothetical protein
MRTAYLKLVLAVAAGIPTAAFAQSGPPSTAPEIANASASQIVEEPPKSTLFKIGTGLTRGFEFGGFSGLSVPVVLGVEHHLTPTVSMYGNLFGGLNIIDRSAYHNRPLLREIGADAGIRYYYNQEKRKQKGRATGPFVGNYLALHSSSSLYSYHTQNSYSPRTYLGYDYSTLNVLWGMQRRIGGHGLIDAYVGGGVANPYRSRYEDGMFRTERRASLNLELGVKLSLVP